MNTNLLNGVAGICLYLLSVSFSPVDDHYETVQVKAPFPMQPIKVFIYPEKDFQAHGKCGSNALSLIWKH